MRAQFEVTLDEIVWVQKLLDTHVLHFLGTATEWASDAFISRMCFITLVLEGLTLRLNCICGRMLLQDDQRKSTTGPSNAIISK